MNESFGMTVSQLNLLVAEALRREPRIRSVSVRGEISSFRHHIASGHWYFSLKDEESAISCVMFRQNNLRARIRPRDGDAVLVTGYVDVYPKNGTYQLYATSLQPSGAGELFLRFEALKQKLNAEGLFDPARKRLLPMCPGKVALVTSGSGAALHDILNVSGARAPSVPIVLIPVSVQGEHAAAEIAAGIRLAGEQTDADVLIVARGGGSAEDLWCFNEEIVARAVVASRIPVVSGVGHEIDTTICDLAADVRAATPSNAAEIVFPDRRELLNRVNAIRQILHRVSISETHKREIKLREAEVRLTALNPGKRISEQRSRSRLYRENLNHSLLVRLEWWRSKIAAARTQLQNTTANQVNQAVSRNNELKEKLIALNPFNVLERGYALVMDRKGHVLSRKEQALKEQNMSIRFADGSLEATVKNDGENEHGT